MAQPYLGEIRMFAGNFAPLDWAFCNGQLLAIAEYNALFDLIGTTYGGDGQSTFALPDLRGRIPIHQGNTYLMGQMLGDEQVILTSSQMPIHSHSLTVSGANATTANPQGNVLAMPTSTKMYRSNAALNTQMATSMFTPTGGSQPHSNMQPSLCINFIIALYGVYPSPT